MTTNDRKAMKAIKEAFSKAEMYDRLMDLLKPNVKFSEAGRATVAEARKQGVKAGDVAKLLHVTPASISKYYNA